MSRTPPPSSPYGAGPVIAAIGFMALLTLSIWWGSRERAEPAKAPPSAAVPAPVKPSASTAPVAAPVPAQVAAFARFAEKEMPEESPAARASAAEGMRLLADAIAARGDSILWRDRAKRLREAAEQVGNAASPEAAANLAHDHLVQAAEWIAGLRFADAGAADATLTAAKAIEEGEPLRSQAGRLEQFFDAAARALGGTST